MWRSRNGVESAAGDSNRANRNPTAAHTAADDGAYAASPA
jgi:hypothetical protein